MTICIDNNYFELNIHRKRIKHAYLRVKPNNVLVVSVPLKMPDNLITDLIKEKAKWIISVSKTVGNDFNDDDIKLMPIPEDQIAEIKYEAEDSAYDSLERMYPRIKPFGVPFPEVRVRYMITRWGSCVIKKNKIWINAYLVKLPPEYMDYVVLHELIHFIHPNHGKDFYKTMEMLMPNWRELRRAMRKIRLPERNAGKKAAKI